MDFSGKKVSSLLTYHRHHRHRMKHLCSPLGSHSVTVRSVLCAARKQGCPLGRARLPCAANPGPVEHCDLVSIATESDVYIHSLSTAVDDIGGVEHIGLGIRGSVGHDLRCGKEL